MLEVERTIALLTYRLLKEETMVKRWTKAQQDTNDAAYFAHNFPMTTLHRTRGVQENESRGGRMIEEEGIREVIDHSEINSIIQIFLFSW